MMTSPQEYREVVLDLLPQQGNVSEDDYFWLTDHANRLIEYTDGFVEVLPTSTDGHQVILKTLLWAFDRAVASAGGIVLFAPLRLRLRAGKIREPDLLLLRDAQDPRRQSRYWTGADLVLEVVSDDSPARDLVEKRQGYEQAGIPEYWIVSPRAETITVLALHEGQYVEHGRFTRGARVTSILLPAFAVEVTTVFGPRANG